MHRKIIEPGLKALEGGRARYFDIVVEKLENDLRLELNPNLVYLVLKDVIPLVPIYLPEDDFINQLFGFVETKGHAINQVIFSAEYLINPEVIRKITGSFVTLIGEAVFDNFEKGEIDSGEQTFHRVNWPLTSEDFPYQDDDDEDGEGL